MRTTALVASISLLLLGGAWYASRALTSDVRPVAPVTSPVVPALPPLLAAPVAVVPSAVAPPEPVAPPAAPVAPVPPEPSQPSPPTEEALSPEALELKGIADQAAAQLADLKGGPANWRRAEKLYERCLFIDSNDARCRAGLESVRRHLGPKAPKAPRPTARPPDWEE
ncbi:MAG: hypothetical protein Q8L48_08975 [Archangium sp.]|nr:hypothetical protein [Archangium sp.]